MVLFDTIHKHLVLVI